MASAAFTRHQRQLFAGQAWWLVEGTQNLQPATLTVFPRGWEVHAGQLHAFDAPARLRAFRSQVNRCGGAGASGYLIAVIHGEFEPRRQVYQLHLHILAAGGLRDIIDTTLRKLPSMASKRSEYGVSEFVWQRVRLDRRLTDLPRQLTYLLKSFWPSRWQGFTAEGKLKRQRQGSRIPEPHHTEVLLWMDRWQLSDITLLMNLSVGRDGFCLSDRAYTNGDIK